MTGLYLNLCRLFLASILVVGCDGGSSGIVGSGGQNQSNTSEETEISEEERIAQLTAVCQQAVPSEEYPIQAVVSTDTSLPTGGLIGQYFIGEFAENPVNASPLLDNEGLERIFDFNQINQFVGNPSNGDFPEGLLDKDGQLIRYDNLKMPSSSESDNVVDELFGVLYTGSIVNNTNETKYYYFAVRSDDGSILQFDFGSGWENIINRDIGTGARLMCPDDVNDLIEMAPGEVLDFRYFFRNGTGPFAVSLLWKDWGSPTPAASLEDIITETDDNCETQQMSEQRLNDAGFFVIPEENFYRELGSTPEGWTDECYELGYGEF